MIWPHTVQQLQYTERQVRENSSKNLLTAASSLTTLPHKLVLLSLPKCEGKLKIIQSRKRGLANWHTPTSSGVKDEAKAQCCWYVRMGQALSQVIRGGWVSPPWLLFSHCFHLAEQRRPSESPSEQNTAKTNSQQIASLTLTSFSLGDTISSLVFSYS